MQVAEYLNEKNASIIVEIYCHKTPVYAFGIYSQERPTMGDFLNIGTQAYIEAPILNFLVGNTYVKINSYRVGNKASEVLQAFANKLVENIDGEESFPKILTCFPDECKKQNPERFFVKNFLGYGFLHSAFTADYIIKNSAFRLFIIQGADLKDCEEILRQYFQFAGDSRRDLKENNYLLSDPYHGKVSFSWKGKYIWGVLNLDEENLRTKYLILMEELLRKQNKVLSN